MLNAICIGGATLDILVKADEESSILLGQKQDVQTIDIAFGGGALNASTIIRKLGGEVSIHCALGRDDTASVLLRHFEKLGISVSDLEFYGDIPTGKAVITIPSSGEASVVAARGANRRLSGASLNQKTCDLLYISSAPGTAYESIAKQLASSSQEFRFISFNPGARQIKDSFHAFELLYSACDLLIVNKNEALQIARQRGVDHLVSSTQELCIALNEADKKYLCISDGEGGSYLSIEDRFYHQPVIKPSEQWQVLSTIGAGDTFGATLSFFLASGLGPDLSQKLAARNAAATISRLDANSGSLTKQKLFRV
jgi:ribokinase